MVIQKVAHEKRQEVYLKITITSVIEIWNKWVKVDYFVVKVQIHDFNKKLLDSNREQQSER